ncbi:type II restriction endonuclease subunit M [Polynucleobacter sphagniphilus]|jgi:hypothetical protein|uniref:Type II restriction endonuclease subunit M n=1 Tax=Polynucleobacter sphagniphilus TaxID=1743169 RepID=A0AA43S6U9_9BURK|nr:type II restriction endonuclease subunit M [Polynucleobacter sphagniphilus]MDH6504882.1 hypothetical protein [Polynucleobacter sphagniphilus]MDH6512942.1 hypothetical protein [Polynucleobacter sphagniphilus]
MSLFLRLLNEADKSSALAMICNRFRTAESDSRIYEVDAELFNAIPGKPFAYWGNNQLRRAFEKYPPFESDGRTAKVGLQTGDNFRFIRLYWEVSSGLAMKKWIPYAKGGGFSRYYSDLHLVCLWDHDGKEIRNFFDINSGKLISVLRNVSYMFRPGITWSTRTTSELSVRILPSGSGFDTKGCAGFVESDNTDEILGTIAITNSKVFGLLIELQLAAGDAAARSYDTGIFNQTPVPKLSSEYQARLKESVLRSWLIKRRLDSISETSHAFLLPSLLRDRLGDYDPNLMNAELIRIQSEIDEIALELYGFTDSDESLETKFTENTNLGDDAGDDEGDEAEAGVEPSLTDGLLSWALGVSFGRFDCRLATGERRAPQEPKPFDPLLSKSPGMLSDKSDAFHKHNGILVDDKGHPHDLVHLIEEVLERVDIPAPNDLRHWLQKDFFTFHLQQYSKSRRKAPIYWPLSTASGSYTLWLYYPDLTAQTIYTAINDFIEPKIKQIESDISSLRIKGAARILEDEKQFELLQLFELELIELRDVLLKIAPAYKPNPGDGVQISAAPFWMLFRFKPWQKILKDTWTKLEKGSYDWTQLSMSYWPERVRSKCVNDKSLAIAHGLEGLYIEPRFKDKDSNKNIFRGVK